MKKTPDDAGAAEEAEAARRRDVAALVRAAGLDPEILDDDESADQDQS